MPERPLRILFLCTGNSARSIVAEALLNHLGKGRFEAVSAGIHPKGVVQPRALRLLEEGGIDTSGLASENVELYAGPGARHLDLVVTLCDCAASEPCPVLPGAPASIHWGLPDPAAVAGDEAEQIDAFERTLADLESRIRLIVSLPLEDLDPARLAEEFRAVHARSSDALARGAESPR